MVNCQNDMNLKKTKILDIKIVSNINELKDKIIQVDKLLDEIRKFEISIQIKPVEFSQEVQD